VVAEAQAARGDPAAMDELAVGVAERVIATLAGTRLVPAAPSGRDVRRISAVVRHVERQADAPIDLDALAGIACMSKYHFLRTFRRIVGVTPYRFTLDLRLRRAAVALRTSAEPVGAIAFGAGFGDLSTFNHRFRAAFGAAPSIFRKT
jgi:transcriptional regulator GlxA family with amidase domain